MKITEIGNGFEITRIILRYNPDQPRDEHGRWGDGGGESFDSKVAGAATGQDALDAAAVYALPAGGTSALAYYESNQAYVLNAAMREGNGSLRGLTDEQRTVVESLDETMRAAGSDLVAYRTVASTDELFGARGESDLTGQSWTDHGFVSTDPNPPPPSGMFSEVQMRIFVPQGTSVLANDRLESEIVLGRGQTFRVAADRGFSPKGDRLLDVEVVA